jgi:hypothetical protein
MLAAAGCWQQPVWTSGDFGSRGGSAEASTHKRPPRLRTQCSPATVAATGHAPGGPRARAGHPGDSSASDCLPLEAARAAGAERQQPPARDAPSRPSAHLGYRRPRGCNLAALHCGRGGLRSPASMADNARCYKVWRLREPPSHRSRRAELALVQRARLDAVGLPGRGPRSGSESSRIAFAATYWTLVNSTTIAVAQPPTATRSHRYCGGPAAPWSAGAGASRSARRLPRLAGARSLARGP